MVMRTRRFKVLRGVVLAGIVVFGGCSVYSVPGGDPAPVESPTDYTPGNADSPSTPAVPERPVAPEPNDSNAYGPLLARASAATDRGDYEQALALLERAQRIDSDSAEIYLHLAATYMAKGDVALATATAERGLLYCQGHSQCDALRSYTR
ncbi:MAG: tetratricopeptide (TPR) repeat protein [Alcanivorax sp.]|jgi:tetratricopeptide (TPR) repeat protein